MHELKLTTYFQDGSQKAHFSNIAATICIPDVFLAEAFSNEKAKRKEEATSSPAAFEKKKENYLKCYIFNYHFDVLARSPKSSTTKMLPASCKKQWVVEQSLATIF